MINLIDMILIVDNVINDDESELLISEFEIKKPFKESSREINSERICAFIHEYFIFNYW